MTAKKETSLINPHILHCQNRKVNLPDLLSDKSRVGCVTKNFLFTNEKLNDLKTKVTTMAKEAGQPIMNPSRVEVLSWLLHNRQMAAATKKNSAAFKPSGMALPADMRGILVEKLPGTSIGNLVFAIEFPTKNPSDLEPHNIIGEMRKRKTAFQSIPNLKTATEIVAQMSPETALETTKRLDASYIYSSLYKFPLYDIDFGWGKPIKVTVGGTVKNVTVFMAAPDGNGIEAVICLEKEDMKVLQNDPELLAYC